MPKATLAAEDGSRLEFRFNPKEYSISKSATWNRPTSKSAKHATAPEFGGVQPQTVQMELFFDDWEGSGDLVKDIETLLGWLKPTDKSINQKKKPQPLALQFRWGGQQPLAEFKGFLKSVSAKYTMFRSDGTPVRATAQISLEEIPTDPPKTNPTSGAIAGRRSHVMAAGDSLHSVAFREYDDPALWRGLAAVNGIDDPLRVAPGTRLLIPTADEAGALS
ncbi:MAG TPA: peptidase M23 [Candidatus Dormibacteraeota bacterium]|nr:peptidase M23 [Candidatus Dormibacteraeota bacterium]